MLPFLYSSKVALIGLQIRNLRRKISGIRLFSSPVFITCQNFQFCKYVRLTVCVSVCEYEYVLIAITHERFDQSSPNFTHICICVAGRSLYFFKVKGQITRSRGQKVSQILKSPYLSQFSSYSRIKTNTM